MNLSLQACAFLIAFNLGLVVFNFMHLETQGFWFGINLLGVVGGVIAFVKVKQEQEYHKALKTVREEKDE
jgi:hypothetical protein